MKRDAFDVFKVIVLVIVTSLLVMAYTTIEKSISVSSEKSNLAIPGANPVAPKLAGKSKNTGPVQKAIKNE